MCGGELKGKKIGKGKELEKRKYFSNSKHENIGDTDSWVEVDHAGKQFRKYRNRPEIEYL